MTDDLRERWLSAGGKAPDHWNFVAIEDLLANSKSISVGVMYPGTDTADGVPLIKVSDVKDGAIASQPKSCISKSVDEEYKRTRLDGSELLITLVGNPGDCVVVNDEMAGWNVARALAVVRLGDTDLRAWLRYALLSGPAKHLIGSRLNTTVQKTLNLKDIRELGLPIPPQKEREEIVQIIGGIEKKMLLNRQANQTLEEMAQAVFKSWFVDFEPTRAKIKARENGQDPTRAAMAAIAGKTVDQLDTLSPEQINSLTTTADLFPDKLIQSELGEIPEGWLAGELKDIAEFSTDRVDVSNLTLQNYISTENMLEGKRGISSASSLPAVKTVPSFDLGQILISNIRPYFMKIWLARFQGGRSNDVLGIEAKEAGGTEYLYNLLYQDKFFEFMMTTSKGAKMPRGDKDAIMGWRCVHPKLEVKKAYSTLVSGFYTNIETKNEENRSLEQLRDTLLPKLLSGELEVANRD